MTYLHAWHNTHGNINRDRSIVIDPAAWGHDTSWRRDSVDRGTAHSPRFWNTCGDVDQAQPRLVTDGDVSQYDYVDFKLYAASHTCTDQWQWLQQWLDVKKSPRILHTVNEARQDRLDSTGVRLEYASYSQWNTVFRRLSVPAPVHLDATVRVADLDQEQQAVADTVQTLEHINTCSFVINVVWNAYARVHIFKHPVYDTGSVIVKPY